MQTKTFLSAALFSALSVVIAEPAPQADAQTTQVAARESKVIHDIDVFFSSVTAAPDWSSYSSIIAAYSSEDLLGSFTDVSADALSTALPDGVRSYAVSIVNAYNSIVSNDLYGDTSQPTTVAASGATGKATTGGAAPKPTGAVMAAGAVAAGLLGVIAML